MRKPLILIIIVLVIDQIIKIYIKTHFYLSEEISVFGLEWFKIHFIENKGMAFGMNFGDNIGKFLLTFVRIIASILIFIYMRKLSKDKSNKYIIYAFALIFAGAVGNIIDCLAYGMVFSESTFFQVATLFPQGGGYAPFMFGKVVDMFYFPLIDSYWPDWIPFIGGQHFSFFNAIFNFSDACITIGVILMFFFIFKKEYHSKQLQKAIK